MHRFGREHTLGLNTAIAITVYLLVQKNRLTYHCLCFTCIYTVVLLFARGLLFRAKLRHALFGIKFINAE